MRTALLRHWTFLYSRKATWKSVGSSAAQAGECFQNAVKCAASMHVFMLRMNGSLLTVNHR